jgi:hypothetical protein
MRPALVLLGMAAAGTFGALFACAADSTTNYGVPDGLPKTGPPMPDAGSTSTPMDATAPTDGGGKGDGAAEAAPSSCKQSWTKDVFPLLQSTGTGGCGSTNGCHGPGGGQIPSIVDDDAGGTYAGFTTFTVIDSKPYIAVGDMNPTDSMMDCQLVLGSCGDTMPPTTSGKMLGTTDKSTIDSWIKCGSPNN